MKKLDEKYTFLSPTKVLEQIGLEPGDTVIDYGSGPGHWVIPAAKMVAPKGIVYAIEENMEILQLIKNVAAIQKVTNIELEELNLQKPKSQIKDKADLLIVSNILHLLSDKKSVITEISNLLKDDGCLLIIEWSKENLMLGPSKDLRMKEEEIMSVCEKSGFEFKCTVDTGWHHVGLIFEKSKKG